MASYINTNLSSLTAQTNLGKAQNALSTSMQRLSSGMRINSAADDTAGAAVATRLTSQINGLGQATLNANDAISLTQTADTGMESIVKSLQSMRTLAVQASNATYSAADRSSMNAQVQQLKSEIDRVANGTKFNGTNLLDGSFTAQNFQVGADNTADDSITLTAIDSMKTASLGGNGATTQAIVTGTTKTTGTAALLAGGLTLNGKSVGASAGGMAGQTASSAFSIAKAINATAGTGVTATAAINSVTGGALETTPSNVASFSVNGISVGAIAAGTTAAGQGAKLANAINGVSTQSGVTAVADSASGILTLTAADGRDITIGLDNTAVAGLGNTAAQNAAAAQTAFKTATGLTSGVQAYQTVAGAAKVDGSIGVTVGGANGTVTAQGVGAGNKGSLIQAGQGFSINGVDVGAVTSTGDLRQLADSINISQANALAGGQTDATVSASVNAKGQLVLQNSQNKTIQVGLLGTTTAAQVTAMTGLSTAQVTAAQKTLTVTAGTPPADPDNAGGGWAAKRFSINGTDIGAIGIGSDVNSIAGQINSTQAAAGGTVTASVDTGKLVLADSKGSAIMLAAVGGTSAAQLVSMTGLSLTQATAGLDATQGLAVTTRTVFTHGLTLSDGVAKVSQLTAGNVGAQLDSASTDTAANLTINTIDVGITVDKNTTTLALATAINASQAAAHALDNTKGTVSASIDGNGKLTLADSKTASITIGARGTLSNADLSTITGYTVGAGALALSTTAPALTGTVAAAAFNINGVDIGAIAQGSDVAHQGANVADAINLAGIDGVTAAADATTGAVTLTNTKGMAIAIKMNGTATDGATEATNQANLTSLTGLFFGSQAYNGSGVHAADNAAGTNHSSLTLDSASDIIIGGTTAGLLTSGFTAGQTSAAAIASATTISAVTVASVSGAKSALGAIDGAISMVNSNQGYIGALQNRFGSAIENLQSTSVNLSSARMRIRDVDFASETANMTRAQVLSQASMAILGQANQQPSQVMALLR